MSGEQEKLVKQLQEAQEPSVRKAIVTRLTHLDNVEEDSKSNSGLAGAAYNNTINFVRDNTKWLEEYRGRVTDEMMAYSNDEINMGEVALRTVGEAGRAVGDAVGYYPGQAAKAAYNNMRPETQKLLADGAKDIAQGVMDTDAAKKAMQLAKENPRVAKNLGSLLSASELVMPMRSLVGTPAFVNGVGHNFRTLVKGFYSDNPIDKVTGVSNNLTEGLGDALLTPFSASRLSQRENLNQGQVRINEMTSPDTPHLDAQGSIMASSMMNAQEKGINNLADDVISNLPSVKASINVHTTLPDAPSIKAGLQSANGPEVPPNIMDDMFGRIQQTIKNEDGTWGVTDVVEKGLLSKTGFEGFAKTMFNVKKPDPKKTQIIVRNDDMNMAAMGREAAGDAANMGSSVVKRMKSSTHTESFAKSIGKTTNELTPEDLTLFLQETIAFEKSNWGRSAVTKEILGKERTLLNDTRMQSNLPDDVKHKDLTKKQKNEGKTKGEVLKPAEAYDIYRQATNHVHRSKDKIQALADKKGVAISELSADDLMAATRKPLAKKPTKAQIASGNIPDRAGLSKKQALMYIEGQKKVKQIQKSNNAQLGEDGIIRYKTSYNSQERELGGVGLIVSFDTKTNTGYSAAIDGHNMFGANPAGGDSLFTLSEIQTFGVGSNAGGIPKRVRQTGERGPSNQQQIIDAAARKTEELTGVRRGTAPRSLQHQPGGKGTPMIDNTNVEPEGLLEYGKRAMSAVADRPATGRQKRQAAYNQAGLLSGLMEPIQSNDDERVSNNSPPSNFMRKGGY
jgi:hypothetical protein